MRALDLHGPLGRAARKAAPHQGGFFILPAGRLLATPVHTLPHFWGRRASPSNFVRAQVEVSSACDSAVWSRIRLSASVKRIRNTLDRQSFGCFFGRTIVATL